MVGYLQFRFLKWPLIIAIFKKLMARPSPAKIPAVHPQDVAPQEAADELEKA